MLIGTNNFANLKLGKISFKAFSIVSFDSASVHYGLVYKGAPNKLIFPLKKENFSCAFQFNSI